MKITILYFASFRELVGIPKEIIELEDGAQLITLKQHLEGLHPGLKEQWNISILSVNKKYVNPEIILRDGDEVAIIPPISGG